MMTREDILRELELLPVWQLRTPLPQALVVSALALQSEAEQTALAELVQVAVPEEIVPNNLKQVEAVAVPMPLTVPPMLEPEPLELKPQELKPQEFRHAMSEEGDWLFVLANTIPQADEMLLLRNIFIAMGIKTKPAEAPTIAVDILAATKPKLVVAMGEAVAQCLLRSTESLASLRGTVHAWESIALVATYDLAHLLQVLPDKAKAWDDLCLAMQVLQRLKSAN